MTILLNVCTVVGAISIGGTLGVLSLLAAGEIVDRWRSWRRFTRAAASWRQEVEQMPYVLEKWR